MKAKDLKVGDILLGLGPVEWVEHIGGEIHVDYLDRCDGPSTLGDKRPSSNWYINEPD